MPGRSESKTEQAVTGYDPSWIRDTCVMSDAKQTRRDKQKKLRAMEQAMINSDGNVSGTLHTPGWMGTVKKRYFELVGNRLYSYKSKKKFDEKSDLQKEKSELLVGLQSATRCQYNEKKQMVPIHLVFVIGKQNSDTKLVEQKKVSKVMWVHVHYDMTKRKGRQQENFAELANSENGADIWADAFSKLIPSAAELADADAKAHYAKLNQGGTAREIAKMHAGNQGSGEIKQLEDEIKLLKQKKSKASDDDDEEEEARLEKMIKQAKAQLIELKKSKKKQKRPTLAQSLNNFGFAALAAEANEENEIIRSYKRQQTPDGEEKRSYKRQQTPDGEEHFVNQATQETTWELPEDGLLNVESAAAKANSTFKRFSTPEGKTYFMNTVTNETCWSLPKGATLEDEAGPPTPQKFGRFQTAEGKDYFVNKTTQETCWTLPKGAVVE